MPSALSCLNIANAVDTAKLLVVNASFNNFVSTITVSTALRAICHWSLFDMLCFFTSVYPVNRSFRSYSYQSYCPGFFTFPFFQTKWLLESS